MYFSILKPFYLRRNDLSIIQFGRIMFESHIALTIISAYGKYPHLKIIQKINQRLAQLAVLPDLSTSKHTTT